ncbi:hypothetical protein [Pedobacter cryoconitis]|uniref:Putative membrane protein n=1 Tax=Pedobacter cryoconitis TaxID=188932 RepID=A0A7X0J7N8_9SPHI|nr:hypothetical protein [Pedobacter cryoconitis]MBB6501817.1 putative membrane protein [Pedobacter cryoconitis]
MEQTGINESPETKAYKENSVWFGTILGGPLTATYLLAENYKFSGETGKAKQIWIFGVLFTLGLLSLVCILPSALLDKIPKFIVPLFITCMAQYIFQRYQKDKIADHIQKGGQLFGFWRVFLISLIGLILTFALTAVLFLSFGDTA